MSRRYWNAPRDLETIPRSLLRKVSPLGPSTSYPFLSGDTFRSFCALEFSDSGELINNEAIDRLRVRPDLIFSHAFPDSFSAIKLKDNLERRYPRFDFSNFSLVIHNGDVIPGNTEMEYLAKRFHKVHSVNWLGDPSLVNPLPIGLENKSKRRNGVPSDYKAMIENLNSENRNRDIELLICFSLHTNPEERTRALNFGKAVPGVFINLDPITPRAYRKLLLRSKFVLSPPGNGPDCHRTWEALYLGATPIVIKSKWPKFKSEISVLELASFEQLESKIQIGDDFDTSRVPLPEFWLE